MISAMRKSTLIGVAMLILGAPVAHCQFTPEDTGMAPFGSFSGGSIDSVDMVSGALNLHIPLFSLPQKGKLALSFSLRLTPYPYTPNVNCNLIYEGCQVVYQQLGYSPIPSGSPTGTPAIYWDQQIAEVPASAPMLQTTFSWGYGFDPFAGGAFSVGGPFLETTYYYSDWFSLQDGSGQMHPLGFDSANPNIMRATDGSGYTVGDFSATNYKYSQPNSGPPYWSGNSWSSTAPPVVDKNGVVWTNLCSSLGNGTQSTTPTPALWDPMGNSIGCNVNPQMLDPTYHLPAAELVDSAQRNIPLTPFNMAWATSDVSKCPNLSQDIQKEQTFLAQQHQGQSARAQPPAYSMDWTVPGPNGTVTYTICYAKISYRTEFIGSGLNGIWTGNYPLFEGDPSLQNNTLTGGVLWWDMAGGETVIQSVVLPNGTHWGFIYGTGGPLTTLSISDPIDPAWTHEGYGDVLRVVLPTGGSISYIYGNVYDLKCAPADDLPSMHIRHVVTSRTVDDANGNVAQWAYNGMGNSVMTETGPSVNGEQSDTVHTFGCLGNTNMAYETETDQYEGSHSAGNLLKSASTTYLYGTDPQDYYHPEMNSAINVRPYQTTESLNGVVQSVTTYSYQPLFTDVVPTCSFTNSSEQPPLPQPSSCAPDSTVYLPTVQLYYSQPSSTLVQDGNGNTLSSSATTFLFTQSPNYNNYSTNNYFTANMLALPSEDTLDGLGDTRYGYDESPSPQGVLGNQTHVSRFDNVNNAWLKAQTQYSGTGMPIEKCEANDPTCAHPTTYQYNDSTGVFVTTETDPIGTQLYVHDSATGLVTSYTDYNTQTRTYTYDVAGRPLLTSYPDLGKTLHCYTDTGGTLFSGTCLQTLPPYQAVAQQLISTQSSIPKSTTTTYDGLGRAIQTQLTSGLQGTLTSTVTYDPLGRVSSKSNPYYSTSDSTYGFAIYAYDALGRVRTQTAQDTTSVQHWLYSGLTVNYQDENGNSWQRTSDGLGRLIQVVEQGSTATPLHLTTNYAYDLLGNLSSVNQLGNSGGGGSDTPHARSFSYDSLSRLITSTNPETGTINYSYVTPSNTLCAGDSSLLCSKTDARGVITYYGYDNVDHLLSKTYSGTGSAASAIAAATPFACFQYGSGPTGNTIGRLINEWSQKSGCNASPGQAPAGSVKALHSILAYDPVGRLLQDTRCSGSGNCNAQTFRLMTYSYDLAGNQTSSSDGVGSRTFTTQYDTAERLLNFIGGIPNSLQPSAVPLLSIQNYGAVGWTGASIGTNINAQRSYDSRTRVTGEAVSIP